MMLNEGDLERSDWELGLRVHCLKRRGGNGHLLLVAMITCLRKQIAF